MKNKKSFRYKGADFDNLGIHSEFMKTRVNNNHWYSIWKFPKPQNNAEISMLSKFIFGVELSASFDYFYDLLSEQIKKDDDIQFNRLIKLNNLNSNKLDYINKKNAPEHSRTHDDKMVLITHMYKCDQFYNPYDDNKFNDEVFKSSYETNDQFWKHCLGPLYCGGIGGVAYGQVYITSLTDYHRLINLYKNTNEPVRECFKNEIDKLIILDKKYD